MAINGIFTALTKNFVMSDKQLVQDSSISGEARFIYIMIQSDITNPNFTIYKNRYVKMSGWSVQKFNRYWNELKNAGLLIMRKLRDTKNQFYYVYELVPSHHACPETDLPPMETPSNEDATQWESTLYTKTDSTEIETNTNLNNTSVPLDDNDDRKAMNHPSSYKVSSKNKTMRQFFHRTYMSFENDFTSFIDTWKQVTGKDILLTDTQKHNLDSLIKKYSYQTVLFAIHKIKESQYLTNNINISYFISCFEKIYSDTYKDRVPVQATASNSCVVKKTRFNIMDSHTWNFEELDRLEDAYIERVIAGDID